MTGEEANYNGLSREEWLQTIEASKNPFYEYPSDENVPVWRYVTLDKFLWFLENESLYFSRADLLGDPFEGAVSKNNLDEQRKQLEKFFESVKAEDGNPVSKIHIDLEVDSRQRILSDFGLASRRFTYINCWHVNEHESDAMWKVYASQDSAIAIQSTFSKLYACIRPHKIPPHGQPIIGLVKYFDYEKDFISKNVRLSEYFCKRKSFEHERELRIVFQNTPTHWAVSWEPDGLTIWETHNGEDVKVSPAEGQSLSVDITNLLEKIFIPPTAPDWFFEMMKNVVGKYGVNPDKVKRSSLLNDPHFQM